MKAKELKIGDYFFIENTPVKIKTLVDDEISIVKYGEVAPANIGDLIPIPLTSEILEKNGWEEDDEIWSIVYAFGKMNVEFFQWGKKIVAMISIMNDNKMCSLKQIKYIHELQHILWALGMDDDLKI